jgi:hypothetical protein
MLLSSLAVPGAVSAADDASFKTVAGLVVYLGVLPAAIIQGHVKDHPEETMHGGIPRGPHAYHVMVAIFDAVTGERMEKATVQARVTPLGFATVTRELEPMVIAGTVTYGNYFTMRGADPYRIEFSITPAESATPVTLEFSYEHGTR